MPIIVKNPKGGKIDEFMMLELQGDLENRQEEIKDCSGNFIGDVLYNKFGHPVSFVLPPKVRQKYRHNINQF